jgi:hypothetical protein
MKRLWNWITGKPKTVCYLAICPRCHDAIETTGHDVTCQTCVAAFGGGHINVEKPK